MDEIVKPPKRWPFTWGAKNRRKQVEEELYMLIEQGIIEIAEGPTTWISPIHGK